MSLIDSVCNKLTHSIESASCLADLIPILNTSQFDIDVIKPAMKQHISSMTINQQHSVYFKSQTLDQIFPDDILKHILSFEHDFRSIKLLNKSFQNCCDSVQSLFLRQTHSQYQKEFNESIANTVNNTRIFDVFPTHCNDISTLRAAIAAATSGDILLIHDGLYQIPKGFSLEINKTIKLIGIGSINVVTKASEDHEYTGDRCYIYSESGYLYIRNIKCEGLYFQLCNTSLWMEHCHITTAFYGIYSFSSKSIKLRESIICGGERYNYCGLLFDGKPEIIEIEYCLFENLSKDYEDNEDHCITFNFSRSDNTKLRKIKVNGNHFKNNFTYPIASADISLETEIHGNTLEGFNGTLLDNQSVTTANKLYHKLYHID